MSPQSIVRGQGGVKERLGVDGLGYALLSAHSGHVKYLPT